MSSLVGIVVSLLTSIPCTLAAPETKQALPVAKGTNFSLQYDVTIDPANIETAQVTLTVAGADELEYIKFVQHENRYQDFHGTGSLERLPQETLWVPGKIFGAISYTVAIPHRRSTHKGFDSYVTSTWMLTRMDDFFPDLKVGFVQPAKSLTRVQFHLPSTWQAVTALDPIADNLFECPAGKKKYNWPTGWALLGKIDTMKREVAGITITLAKPYEVDFSLAALSSWIAPVLGKLKTILPQYPERVLVVIGNDPMWRGGLSGERSLYLHKDMPLIAEDHTAMIVHELFHIGQRFTKEKHTGEWIVEGLAEYYSLKIPHDLGYLDDKAFRQGLKAFANQGRWGVALDRSRHHNVLYNSAPLIHYQIDQKIQEHTQGRMDLDAVVATLAQSQDRIGTKEYLAIIEKLSGVPFADFFAQYVSQGIKPAVP